MKHKYYRVLFLLFFSSWCLGDISKKDIDSSIDKKDLIHPYLLFSQNDKEIVIKRINENSECRDIWKRLAAEANRLIHQPVDHNIPVQGKNPRADWTEYDSDGNYESYYRMNLDNALTLAFVYQMTGEKKYADKAFEFADAFCDLTTWTMRPHEFPIIYSRIMPWNVPDDQVCFSFDHYNGDAGRNMAYVYDWLYPALDRSQRDRIRGALLEKVITRVRGDYEYHWWATAYRCNWCGVCNSGVGMAGMALLTEDPQLVDVVAESFNRIGKMLDELGVDGGWQEGCSYWGYALRTSVQFADALKRLTHGKFNLFNHPKLKNNPVTFPLYMSVPPNRSVNFGDSGSRMVGPTFLINKLAIETGDPGAAWYRHRLQGERFDILDILWPKPEKIVQVPQKTSMHFRSLDFWVMRSDFTDPSKVVVAGKAGKNDDPHHGHLDIGQFVIFWQGQAFIGEIERSSYDEKYFDDARWDYPQASSIGHNVIFVNGEKQISGKMYKQAYNYEVGGKVLEFRTTPGKDYVLMDPTNAYPKKELGNWRRHVILEKPDLTLVLDEIECSKGDDVKARFHSECQIKSDKKYVILEGEKSKMALIPLINNDFTITIDRHALLPVRAGVELTWFPYIDVSVKSDKNRTVIGTLILPVDDEIEAALIAESAAISEGKSGEVAVSLTRKNQEFKYQFKNQKSGLLWVN